MTKTGFASMSEERRIRLQLQQRTDDQLAVMLAKPDLRDELRTVCTDIMIERGKGGK